MTMGNVPSSAEARDMPEGWVETALDRLLVSLESGSRPRGGVRGIAKGVPSVGGEHLDSDGGFRFDNIKYVPEAFFEGMRRGHIQVGDVLVVKDGATTGKVALVRKDFPHKRAVVNEHVFVCRPAAGVNSGFLFWFLFSQEGQSRILGNFQGSAQGGINQGFAPGTALPLAPETEQKRIVAKVEALLARVNAARERLAKVPKILKRFRQSVLAAACSGRLTEDWRDRNREVEAAGQVLTRSAPVHTKASRRRAGRLWGGGQVPPLTEDERESLPSSWAWCKVSDLGNNPDEAVQVGPMSMQSRDFEDTGVPVLNVGCVQWGFFDLSKLNYMPPQKAREFDRYRIAAGDVLFTRSGTIGRCAVAGHSQAGHLMTFHLLRVRPDNRKCLSRYAQFVFQGAAHIRRQMDEASIGSTRAGFNTGLLAGLDVPLPPLAEQSEIVRRVEALFKLAAAVERHVAAATKRAEKLTQSILAKAFRGELVPTEAELARLEGRDYEPASVLLERIKAVREGQPKPKGRGGRKKMPRKSRKAAETKKQPLVDVLREAGKRLTPDDLFRGTGFDKEEADDVDRFYEELRAAVQAGHIREHRPNKRDVFLEATGP